MVAVIYTAGTIFHVVRLLTRLDVQEMPFLPDWALVVLGSWGLAGMVVFARDVRFRGAWERLLHWLIVAHLAVSLVLHVWIIYARSHDVLAVFSMGYSYFGAVYFGLFAWRSWTLRLEGA